MARDDWNQWGGPKPERWIGSYLLELVGAVGRFCMNAPPRIVWILIGNFTFFNAVDAFATYLALSRIPTAVELNPAVQLLSAGFMEAKILLVPLLLAALMLAGIMRGKISKPVFVMAVSFLFTAYFALFTYYAAAVEKYSSEEQRGQRSRSIISAAAGREYHAGGLVCG